MKTTLVCSFLLWCLSAGIPAGGQEISFQTAPGPSRIFVPAVAAALPLAAAQVGNPAGAPQADELRIVIVEGEGGLNNIRQGTATRPVVEVRDRNNNPVAGVLVTFLLPDSGPSAAFVDGSRAFTTTTNAAGRATVPTMKPNTISGQFQIQVTATKDGQTAQSMINQNNVVSGGGGGLQAMSAGAKIALIGAIAAAAVLAGVCGSGNCGNDSPPAQAGAAGLRISIGGGGTGAPTFGPPR